jgi:short-subunit dehydrogenase
MKSAQHARGHIAITGASAGIGKAIATHFARPGNALTLVARRRGLLDALAVDAEARGSRTFVAEADMADLDQATGWVDGAVEALGPIDVLVLNAGIQMVGPALSFTDTESEHQLRINVMAPLRLARRVAPAMLERGHGTIVIVSSLSAITHAPQMADYSATKSHVAAFFETLGAELRGSGVHVVTVYPGPVATEMEKAARQKLEDGLLTRSIPTGTPEGLAALIENAVEKRDPRVVYPRVYAATRFARATSQWLTYRLAPRTRS